MRRAIAAVASTAAGLVMLLSFKTHSPAALTTAPAATSTTTPGGSSSSSAGGSGTSASAATTVAGDISQTRYGPVQVQITVKDGKITDVTAIQYPWSDPRDQQINAYAIPALNQEALQAGSADINLISGATYTSDGYIASLQSALGKAGLA